jgi:hypothetical protein
MAKTIQPVSIWYNGQSKVATELDLRIIFDDLETTAQFFYELKEVVVVDEDGGVSKTTLSNGNTTMNGQDYLDWGLSTDINEAAYVYVANKLNLTII